MSGTVTGYSSPLIATSASSLTDVVYINAQSGQTTQWNPEFDQVGFDIKYASGKDGEFCESKVEVRCPHCAYPNHPFKRKKKPVCVETGEEWAGINSKQPFSHYQCICVYCDEAYMLRLFG